MIRNLSDGVIVPIAGVILAFVMTIELIQMVADRNNMHGDVDTWMFFKWIFKTAAAVLIVTNTWNIVMGVFDVGQSVVNSAGGSISGSTSIDISTVIVDLEDRLMEMDVGPLFGLWFQSLFVGITMWALTICIFIMHEFTVHSKRFVHELIIANGLDITKNYPLRGVCAQNGNAILFKMKADLHDMEVL